MPQYTINFIKTLKYILTWLVEGYDLLCAGNASHIILNTYQLEYWFRFRSTYFAVYISFLLLSLVRRNAILKRLKQYRYLYLHKWSCPYQPTLWIVKAVFISVKSKTRAIHSFTSSALPTQKPNLSFRRSSIEFAAFSGKLITWSTKVCLWSRWDC